jgi:hypothetical protein
LKALRLPGRDRWSGTAAGDTTRRGLAAREADAIRVHSAAGVRRDDRHWNGAPCGATAARVHSAAGVRRDDRRRNGAPRAAAAVRVHPAPVIWDHAGAPEAREGCPELLQETGTGGLVPGRGRSGRGPGDRDRCREDESCDSQAESETGHGGFLSSRPLRGEGPAWSQRAPSPEYVAPGRLKIPPSSSFRIEPQGREPLP